MVDWWRGWCWCVDRMKSGGSADVVYVEYVVAVGQRDGGVSLLFMNAGF